MPNKRVIQKKDSKGAGRRCYWGPEGNGGLVTALMVEKTKLVWGMVMSAGFHSRGSLGKWAQPAASLASVVQLHGRHNHSLRERTGLVLECQMTFL